MCGQTARVLALHLLLLLAAALPTSVSAAGCSCGSPCYCYTTDVGAGLTLGQPASSFGTQCIFICGGKGLGGNEPAVFPPEDAFYIDYSNNDLRDSAQLLDGMRREVAVQNAGVLSLSNNPQLFSKAGGLLSSTALSGFDRLFVLNLQRTGLKHIAPDALQGIDALVLLRADDNGLQEVPAAALASQSASLVQIWLDDNPVEELDLQLFAKMPSLRSLSLLNLELKVLRYSYVPVDFTGGLRDFRISFPPRQTVENTAVSIAAGAALLARLSDAYVVVYLGLGPYEMSVQALPQSSSAIYLQIGLFIGVNDYRARLDPQVLLDIMDWPAVAGRLPEDYALYTTEKPQLSFQMGTAITCYVSYTGRRHGAHPIAPNNMTTPPMADGFPVARCDCTLPSEPALEGVSHCEPRQTPIPCAVPEDAPPRSYLPFQMADGTFDCPGGEDELYPEMLWRLKGVPVGHVSGRDGATECLFFDDFPDDPDCNMDCMGLMNVTAHEGVVRMTAVLPDGSPAGCRSGSLCPTGVAMMVGPNSMQGTFGMSTLR